MPRIGQSRKSKHTQSTVELNIVKDLNPKDPETYRIGNEPFFEKQPDEKSRFSTLSKAFSWYHRFYGRKEAKNLMIQYLSLNNKPNEAKILAKVPDEEFAITTHSWLARMTLRGLKLSNFEQSSLDKEITRLLKVVTNPQEKEKSLSGGKRNIPEQKNIIRPNLQTVMREKTREAGGELEGILDNFILSGSKASSNADAVGILAKHNILPQHIGIITEAWKEKLKEYEEVSEGKDSQLIQAYKHLNKSQIKNTIKFVESMLASINAYVNNKKTSRAPRKRKPISPEKMVSKLQWLKEFKDPQFKLNLMSVHPKNLLTASEAWVYDTAKRKLHHYVADDLAKTFSVKGNTLLGFDTLKSEIKTLRKPAMLNDFMKAGKPAKRKEFNEIKAVTITPSGRFNAGMLILQAF